MFSFLQLGKTLKSATTEISRRLCKQCQSSLIQPRYNVHVLYICSYLYIIKCIGRSFLKTDSSDTKFLKLNDYSMSSLLLFGSRTWQLNFLSHLISITVHAIMNMTFLFRKQFSTGHKLFGVWEPDGLVRVQFHMCDLWY